jgi:hexosaminidase
MRVWVRIAPVIGPADSFFPRGTIASGTSVVFLSPDFNITSNGTSSTLLDAAMDRYAALISSQQTQGKDKGLASLAVTVAQVSVPLQLGVDESYSLNIPDCDGCVAILSADTPWGVLRGLESFVQLVVVSLTEGPSIPGVPIAFSDAPRFPHRGLLLDTARHYLPLDVILRQIDALHWTKMNTLHWCGVSFPSLGAGFCFNVFTSYRLPGMLWMLRATPCR